MYNRDLLKLAVAAVLLAAGTINVSDARPGQRRHAGMAVADSRIAVPGNTPDILRAAEPSGDDCDPAQRLPVVLGLKLRNVGDLDKLLRDLQDPHSARYRKFLTNEEWTDRFAPTKSDHDRVVKYLKDSGLKVTGVFANRLLIAAEGSVKKISSTFGVHLRNYEYNGQVAFSNDDDPKVAAALSPCLQSIAGLDSFSRYDSYVLALSQNAASGSLAPPAVPASFPKKGGGLTPAQLATAYNFPSSLNPNASHSYSGKHHKIGIVGVHNFDPDDTNYFFRAACVTRTGTITVRSVNGTPVVTSESLETTLDLEQIGVHAPDADIVLYLGTDPSLTTFELAYNQMLTEEHPVECCAVCWSLCERLAGAAHRATHSALFKNAAARGIAIFCSTGDRGAYACRDAEGKGKAAISYPSSDPNVTAVGGTVITLDNSNQRKSEVVWTGSGGGVSDIWKLPDWQKGPGVPKNNARNTVDVSFAATNFWTRFQGKWSSIYGSSCSAPNWAVIWLMACEASEKRLGVANELLYEIGNSKDYDKCFFDVREGANGYDLGPGIKAGASWDPPTGWGTPDVSRLVEWIVNKNKKTN